MKLSSADFEEGDYLGNSQILSATYGFGCAGGNLSPQLSWSGVPEETQSFALTCFDPDAPTGSGFWHWVLVNIPKHVRSLDAGAGEPTGGKLPTGALQVRTDFGAPGYAGPCPPEGDHPHRYIFTVHAVSLSQLPVTADSSAALVGFYLHYNSLARASLTGLYKR